MRVWSRAEAGLTVAPEPFRPFLLLSDPDLLRGFKGDVQVLPLEGEGVYRWLAECPDWNGALRARDHCQHTSARGPGAPDAPYRFFADAVHQFLLRSGKTSFLGMSFGDLRRLALDIEVTTAPGFEFPNAARESDRIVAIALADSAGFTRVLSGADMSEAELLAECSRLIRERDPDTIEGHNIFRFDLEYIEARARRHGVALAWGRGGAPLRGHPARMQVADRSIAYRRYAVTGRHIIDTWILAQLYDVAARDLPSYGLKDVARHFGVAAPERTYLPPEDIPRIFLEEPARLMAYARDDVTETLSLSAILSPPYFVQAQALPFDYQMAVLRGNATKIDALLLREYLHHRRAVPAPQTGRGVAGGYTAVFHQGVARDVLHVDVASLYPSLMLGQHLFPAADALGVSGSLLADLRTFRLSAKALAREAESEADRALLGGLQQTFKIFINSFYGYLGFSQGHWNDFDAANRVTAEGRRLVTAPGRAARGPRGDGARGRHRRLVLRPRARQSRERGGADRRARGHPSRGHPARARRPIPGDVQLQDEELRPPRSPRKAPRQGLGAALAGHRAVPAQVDGGDVPALAHRAARRDPRPGRAVGGRLPDASRSREGLHEDGDAPGVARRLSGQAQGGPAQSGRRVRAGAQIVPPVSARATRCPTT